ncbi:hypothetical protein [Streptomyces sp. NBC_01013]|uniref:hypothetical protein n=1 Tax=Streptomyces sp. NBC_01013 TaxID=2903718 RepID=UPI003863D3CE|nr:hypothetical protein OG538_35690 [Streptomyces sp. NBC_01013]
MIARTRHTLFELTDALLRADGPVTTPVDLTLTAEHRRGHPARPRTPARLEESAPCHPLRHGQGDRTPGTIAERDQVRP